VVLAGLDDRGPDLVALLVGTPDLEAGHTRHAVTQGRDRPTRHRDLTDVEELDVGYGPTVELLEDLGGVRALDLVPVVAPHDPAAAGARRRPVVTLQGHVEVTGLGVELDPVHGGHPPDHVEAILLGPEDDDVADHVAVVAAGHEVLGLRGGEALEAVDGQTGQEPVGVRSRHRELGHVVGLIEENRGVAPGPLLVTPVGELRGDHGVDVRSDLGVTKHVDRAVDGVQYVLEALATHVGSSGSGGRGPAPRDPPPATLTKRGVRFSIRRMEFTSTESASTMAERARVMAQ
jgi:hypothetical protein